MIRLLPILLLFSASFAFTQSDLADFLSAPFPTHLTADRAGRQLVWVFNDQGVRNIFLATSPDFAARPLTTYTADDGMDIGDLQFSPDGRRLYFVRGNAPNRQGEPANPALLPTSTERVIWTIRLDSQEADPRRLATGTNPLPTPDGQRVAFFSGGEVKLATWRDDSLSTKTLFRTRGGLGQLRWSPDGRKLAFVSRRGDHAFVGWYDLDKEQVFLPDTGLDHDGHPAWSPDGRYLAYLRAPNIYRRLPFTPVREGPSWSIRRIDVQTQTVNEVWQAPAGRGSIFFDDLPTEDNLLWWTATDELVFPYEGNGWQQLYAYSLKDQKLRHLTPGEGEVENVRLAEDGKTIYYATNIGDIHRRHLWRLSLTGGQAEQLTQGEGAEWSPVAVQGGLALLQAAAARPAWPALLRNGQLRALAQDRFPASFPDNLVKPQVINIAATDGMEVPAQLFLPPNYRADRQYPALIFLHGGSRRQMLPVFHYGLYYSHAYALNQYFASRGYIVLSLNYRSGIGYGLDFREADRYGAAGASEVRDLIGAGLYLRNRPDIADDKIALWGGSYGGYLTAHGLAQASDLFACGVDIHGVHDWNTEIPTFAAWYDPANQPEVAALARASSPEHFLAGWRSPVLLIHGDDDRNVPFNETVRLAELLRRQGVYFEELVLPDEVHSFLLHRNWVKAYQATFDFIDRMLKKS